jgi:hypothetical protein
MFCPNCGNQIAENLKFCRNCGLKLGKVSQILAEENLQNQETNIFANRKLFEKLGTISFVCFLGMAFGYVFYLAVYYKFLLFGKEWMAFFALFGFAVLGILTLFFFNFHKFYNRRNLETELPDEIEETEEKLLSEGDFQPVPSVTENSTELLLNKNQTRKFK